MANVLRLLGASSDVEVIASWLQGELGSERFGARIAAILDELGVDHEVLRAPDVSDREENRLRRSILEAYRGYGTADHNLLGGFPAEEVIWERVGLDPTELLSVLYIDWDYWLELSGGTRSPVDAAKSIVAGHVVYDVPNDAFLATAAAVRDGQRLRPIVVVTAGPKARKVVVEGHHRLTACALAADSLPTSTEVFLGTAEALNGWWAY